MSSLQIKFILFKIQNLTNSIFGTEKWCFLAGEEFRRKYSLGYFMFLKRLERKLNLRFKRAGPLSFLLGYLVTSKFIRAV